jgi:multimeric flavodoxin WrbA
MKVLGISCSPRKGKSSYKALQVALEACVEQEPQIKTEIIDLGGKTILPCKSCGQCMKGLKCSIDDDFNALISTLEDSEIAGMIISTPVYFGSMAGHCKAFIERCVMFRRNGWKFRNRVGAVIAVGGVRNGGQELAIQGVQSGLFCQDMVCVSDGVPMSHFGATLHSNPKTGISEDMFGLETAKSTGRRVAELAIKISL